MRITIPVNVNVEVAAICTDEQRILLEKAMQSFATTLTYCLRDGFSDHLDAFMSEEEISKLEQLNIHSLSVSVPE